MTARIREFLKQRTGEGPCLVLDLDVVRENYLLFAKALPVETAARVWDAFCFEGETAFYRICIGLLCQQSADLLALSFEHIIRRLTRLADAPVHHEVLFSAVEKVPPVNASQLPPGPANNGAVSSMPTSTNTTRFKRANLKPFMESPQRSSKKKPRRQFAMSIVVPQ
jgi:hypothetical protein